jgi:hypothetical protein
MSTFLVGFQPMLFKYIKFLYILGSFMNAYGSKGSKKTRKKDLWKFSYELYLHEKKSMFENSYSPK